MSLSYLSSLPLQTLRLGSLVSLIIKTKRIAEGSATNCDTQTHRQTILDKYMIDDMCSSQTPDRIGLLGKPPAADHPFPSKSQ
jgi:hypothetical protein